MLYPFSTWNVGQRCWQFDLAIAQYCSLAVHLSASDHALRKQALGDDSTATVVQYHIVHCDKSIHVRSDVQYLLYTTTIEASMDLF